MEDGQVSVGTGRSTAHPVHSDLGMGVVVGKTRLTDLPAPLFILPYLRDLP